MRAAARKSELPNMTGHALPARPRPVHVGGQSPSALAERNPAQGLLSYWLRLYRICDPCTYVPTTLTKSVSVDTPAKNGHAPCPFHS